MEMEPEEGVRKRRRNVTDTYTSLGERIHIKPLTWPFMLVANFSLYASGWKTKKGRLHCQKRKRWTRFPLTSNFFLFYFLSIYFYFYFFGRGLRTTGQRD